MMIVCTLFSMAAIFWHRDRPSIFAMRISVITMSIGLV